MDTLRYRRWHPPESPLRVEIADKLLEELRCDPESEEKTGLLFGKRHHDEVRIEASTQGKGQELVGVFISRPRGDVFLTEADLESFEAQQVSVALSIAGSRAGFFVRAEDGCVQTVRSYEEFSIEEPAAPVPRSVPQSPPPRRWTRFAGIGAVWMIAMLPVAALGYLRPHATALPPAALAVQEQNGELHISWRAGQTAVLAISDGADQTSIPVLPDQSNATYLRRGTDVEIRLIRLDAAGTPSTEFARFVGSAPPLSPAQQIEARLAQLKAEASGLREAIEKNRARERLLLKKIAALTTPAR